MQALSRVLGRKDESNTIPIFQNRRGNWHVTNQCGIPCKGTDGILYTVNLETNRKGLFLAEASKKSFTMEIDFSQHIDKRKNGRVAKRDKEAVTDVEGQRRG